jgi:hypothetical protein
VIVQDELSYQTLVAFMLVPEKKILNHRIKAATQWLTHHVATVNTVFHNLSTLLTTPTA